jgi:acyl carrier protein
MERQEILNIVKNQFELLRDTFPQDEHFVIEDNMILFGTDSTIDSLSLVSLIVDIEALFFDEYDLEISLTDDNAMTRAISPYDTVSTLVDFIIELIEEKKIN